MYDPQFVLGSVSQDGLANWMHLDRPTTNHSSKMCDVTSQNSKVNEAAP